MYHKRISWDSSSSVACQRLRLQVSYLYGFQDEYPRTLSSFVLNNTFFSVTFTARLGLKHWASINEKKRRDHLLNISTVLVEFHKAQCYFISAIQIAAFVLTRQADDTYMHYRSPPLFDLLLSFPLALNGFLPVIFTLSCISIHSRLSWHVVTLSVGSIALSTGTLTSACNWISMVKHSCSNYDTRCHEAFGYDYDHLGNAYWKGFVCGSKSGYNQVDMENFHFP